MKRFLSLLFIAGCGWQLLQAQTINTPKKDSVSYAKKVIDHGLAPLNIKIDTVAAKTLEVNKSKNQNVKGSLLKSTSTNEEGATEGAFDVSATGGANFSLTIATPPSLNGYAPQISLIYNSQAGNGVAGYGWNISGISMITRIAPTKYHDDNVTGVNFNASDRFALDGQRLVIKTGIYGADGAEYQTENYSNLRIFSRGVSSYGASFGPAYFEVWLPDGSKAFYGTTASSKTKNEYGISYTTNAIGAKINYNYNVDDNSLYIAQIQFGDKNYGINQISFNYEQNGRAEQGYISGVLFKRKLYLNNITVVANNTGFRQYNLSYTDLTVNGYRNLSAIEESDGSNTKTLKPVTFTYTPRNNYSIIAKSISGLNPSTIRSDNSDYLTADFNGEGSLDLAIYANTKDKVYLVRDPYDPNFNWSNLNWGVPAINEGFRDIFTGNFIFNQRLISQQGIVLVQDNADGTFKLPTFLYNPTFGSFGKLATLNYTPPKKPNYRSFCDRAYHENEGPIEQKFLSGDFNGDGITDIISISNPYNYVAYEDIADPSIPIDPVTNPCVKTYVNYGYSDVRMLSLDETSTTTSGAYLGALTQSTDYSSKFITADFNGDGKTDLLQIVEGTLYVYGVSNGGLLTLLWQFADPVVKYNKNYILGDFNGDGKMDLMFPSNSDDKTSQFTFLTATAIGFLKTSAYYPFMITIPSGDGSNFVLNHLVASDIDNDGKTDIIEYETTTHNDSAQGVLKVWVHHNTGAGFTGNLIIHSSPGGAPPQYIRGTPTYNAPNINLKHYPVPIFLTPDRANTQLEFGVMSDQSLHMFRSGINVRKETEMVALNQGGTNYQINYASLIAQDGYSYNYNQNYPYVDLESVPSLKVVAKIVKEAEGNSLQQKFSYHKGVSHVQGLGFLGFGETSRSNWTTLGNDQNELYSSTFTDPHKRGAVINSFVSRNAYLNPAISGTPAATPQITSPVSVNDGATLTDYISRTDYTYNTQLLSNKVFINTATAVATKDLLNSTHTLQVNEYDAFYNTTKSTINFNGAGTKTEEITYDNNLSGYYVGRPLTRKTSTAAAGDTHSTEEEFTYTGYLPTQIKKKGHGTPWITEDLGYDSFGNVIQKTISAAGTIRTTSATYDATGRFPISQTDVEGLTSTATYDAATGNLLISTNPYGQTTTNVYDTWGRLTETTDYLGNKTYTSYTTDANGYVFSQTNDEGKEKITYTNHLGQTTQTIEKTITGSLVGTATEYDVYGRAYRQSQPAAPGSYNQWNETEFDEYGRIKKTTAYTGKVTNMSYSGLSTTVNDGTKSITTTKNALGQTTSVQDPGGIINYSYYAHGGLKAANYDGSVQTLEYDGWGRKTKLTDPSAGQYTYTYNGFGDITQETTPKGTTNYSYDNATGKLTGKTLTGDDTGLGYTYSYNNTTKLLNSLTFTNTDGNNANYTYTYDNDKRLLSTVEDNTHARFTKSYTYDDFDRIATETYEAKDKASNTTATRTVAYTYQNGELLQAVDQTTGKILSKVNTLKINGQLATELQGSSLKTTYNYDSFNLPQSIVTERIDTNPATLMNLGYSFDALRGNLNSRSNTALSWSENFTYDNQDRLTDFNDNNGNYSQAYDARGRITSNSQLGNYSYNGASYQQTELTNPTPAATTWYQSHNLQQLTFNAFKKPVNINEQGKEQIDFQYNAALQRSTMYYGSTDADKELRPMRRHYSEDGGMEITRNITTGETSFVFYLSGDAYDAPAIYKEVHTPSSTSASLYYLHRDHLGSIVLITDVDGNAVEKRQFDAWGNLVKLEDGLGNPLTSFLITDRGYTGHEHLLNVGLINMNGRLYDPKLHRFLSPDNFVQEPFNTQNFNRYGYVMNEPLTKVDKSGEILHILIGAAIGGIVNLTVKAVQGKIKNFGDGFAAFGIGAVAGGLGAATGGAALAATGITGGSVVGGALAGGVGATFASPVQGIGNAIYFGDKYSLKNFGRDVLFGAVGGAIVGGATAFVKGKNIWMGGDVAAGRTRFSFNNTDALNPRSSAIGYSLEDLAEEGIDVGKITRKIETDDVAEFLKNHEILARKGNHISKEIVDEYLQQMKNKTFDLRHGAAGYNKGTTFLIDDGHHKIVAATIRGMQTQDFSYLQHLLKNGNFRPWGSGYGMKFGSFPTRWK